MLLSGSVASPSTPLIHSSTLCSSFVYGSSMVLPSIPSSSFNCVVSTRNERRIGKGAMVICMASERRVSMLAKQMKRELGDLLATDQIVQRAIRPESAFGADLYLSSVATITDVDLTDDLQNAKVYVSIFGDERGRKVTMEGLQARTKHMRAQLGKRMRFRRTPQLLFIEDDSIERGNEVIEILDRLKEERERERELRKRRKSKLSKMSMKTMEEEEEEEEEEKEEEDEEEEEEEEKDDLDDDLEDDEDDDDDDDDDGDYDYDEIDKLVDEKLDDDGEFFIK